MDLPKQGVGPSMMKCRRLVALPVMTEGARIGETRLDLVLLSEEF